MAPSWLLYTGDPTSQAPPAATRSITSLPAQLKRSRLCAIARLQGFTVKTVPTKPIEGQKTGTSGLRKKTKVFMSENYLANWCGPAAADWGLLCCILAGGYGCALCMRPTVVEVARCHVSGAATSTSAAGLGWHRGGSGNSSTGAKSFSHQHGRGLRPPRGAAAAHGTCKPKAVERSYGPR